jgi:hypothetical protein
MTVARPALRDRSDVTRYFATEGDVERIGLGLIDRSLPKAEWTHAAHFAATPWLLRRRPDMDLPRRMPDLIRTYNEATGGANTQSEGYHETITQASIRAARAFLARYPVTLPLHEAVDDLMASPLGKPDWLLAYWIRERLFSPAARLAWLEPDLGPLPF